MKNAENQRANQFLNLYVASRSGKSLNGLRP